MRTAFSSCSAASARLGCRAQHQDGARLTGIRDPPPSSDRGSRLLRDYRNSRSAPAPFCPSEAREEAVGSLDFGLAAQDAREPVRKFHYRVCGRVECNLIGRRRAVTHDLVFCHAMPKRKNRFAGLHFLCDKPIKFVLRPVLGENASERDNVQNLSEGVAQVIRPASRPFRSERGQRNLCQAVTKD